MDKKTDYSELRMQNVLKSNMDRIISNGVDYNLTRLEDSIKAIDKVCLSFLFADINLLLSQ